MQYGFIAAVQYLRPSCARGGRPEGVFSLAVPRIPRRVAPQEAGLARRGGADGRAERLARGLRLCEDVALVCGWVRALRVRQERHARPEEECGVPVDPGGDAVGHEPGPNLGRGGLRHAARGERRVEEASQLRVLARDGEGEPLCGGAGVQRPRAGHVLQRRDMHRLWQLVAARSKREPHSVSPRGVCHFRQAAAQRPRRVVAVVDDDGVLLKAGAPGQQQQQHLAVVTALRARLRGGQPVLELRGAAGRRARRVQVEEAVPHAIGQAVPLGFGPQVVDDALVKLARARAVGRIAQAESSTRGEAHCRRGDPQQ
mmetsp:Transcript_8194/g.25993  ORF Transcript_8194/g.25993 Transcript_8194/m.25993 type:complete len:314 (-) Transcript_8194:194-1135(-)